MVKRQAERPGDQFNILRDAEEGDWLEANPGYDAVEIEGNVVEKKMIASRLGADRIAVVTVMIQAEMYGRTSMLVGYKHGNSKTAFAYYRNKRVVENLELLTNSGQVTK